MNDSAAPAPSRAAVVAGSFIAVGIGFFIAGQSRINAGLANAIGDGVLAAFISFGSGLVILCIVMAFAPKGRAGMRRLGTAVRQRSIPWSHLIGGVLGAFFVLSQGLSAAVIGVALFTVAVVSGQTIMGLVIDGRGFGTMPRKPVTSTRVIGAVLAVIAVGIAGSAQLRADIPWPLLLLPLIAGFGMGWQQAANGQVRQVADSALAATFLNFVLGTFVLAIAAGVHLAVVGLPASLPTEPLLYIGGALGVIFIAANTVLVRITGVLLLGLGTVAGQLIGATVLDLIVPVAGYELQLTTIIGTALTLVAVLIAALPRHWWSRRR